MCCCEICYTNKNIFSQNCDNCSKIEWNCLNCSINYKTVINIYFDKKNIKKLCDNCAINSQI